MASAKPQKTLADYVAIALCPVLIMALVGSLVFFLLEVLYVGQYSERLQWTLFFFIFGAVLIARMSMGPVADRSALYGAALGLAVLWALNAYVQPSDPAAVYGWLINLTLMAVIWWCAHKLTWDCTLIDDKVDASGAGLLQVAGLEGTTGEPEPAVPADPGADEAPAEEPTAPGLWGWWQRYRRYREEQRRKPHAPGVWVVYFSLAALPLFGLGQSLIPATEAGRRRYAFWLMGIYLASGLGLLLATSFLGLRRYLRQRKLQMPGTMTGAWLGVGGALAAALLLAGALLPRPNAEYPLVDLSGVLGSQDRHASRYAVKDDSPGKGEGRPSSQAPPNQKAEPGSGTQKDGQGAGHRTGKSGQGSSSSDGSGSGKDQDQQGTGKSGQGSSSKDSSGTGKDPDRDDNDPKRDDSGRSSPPAGQPKEDSGRGSSATSSRREPAGDTGRSQGKQEESSGRRPAAGESRSAPPPSQPPVSNPFSAWSGWLATLLRWVVYAILIVAVIYLVLRMGWSFLRFLSNFTAWAARLLAALQAWWNGLFGWWGGHVAAEAETEDRAQAAPPRPFASFANPFLDGSAGRRSAEELVRYSFEALQAWAWERGLGRQPEETPLEFTGRISEEVPALEADVRRLAVLYARVAYAHGPLPANSTAAVRQFWQALEEVAESPLSAGAARS
jgi:hypothetical protein